MPPEGHVRNPRMERWIRKLAAGQVATAGSTLPPATPPAEVVGDVNAPKEGGDDAPPPDHPGAAPAREAP